MPVVVREWEVRIHSLGIDLPSEASVAFTIGDDKLSDPPDGLGSQTLRLRDGRLEAQPYKIQVADPDGVITAQLFDGGRLRVIGRWAEVRSRVDGGAWGRVDLRRISAVSSPDPVTWEFELTPDASLLRDILFANSADVQLYPLGPTNDWHRQPKAGLADPFGIGNPGEVVATDGDFVQVQINPTPVPADMLGVVREQLDGLRMEAGGADRRVVSFGATATPVDAEDAVGLWLGDPPNLPGAVWVEWPGHGFTAGQNVGYFRLYWPDGVPTSAVTPRLIGPVIDELTGEVEGAGYRLDALVRDVLDGVYGGRRMTYDEASVAALADLGDEGHWFVVEQPITRGDFLREYVWRPYLIAPQARADGTLLPVSVWAGDAVGSTGLYRFTTSNVQGAVRYEAGGTEVANLWRMRARHADRRLPVEGAILPRLDLTEVVRVRAYDAAGETGVEEPHELALGAQIMRRAWSGAMPDLYAERLFALAGDGAVLYRLSAAVEAASPLPGDIVVVDMTALQAPEAQTGSRAGNRIAIVIDRRRSYGAGELRYDYLLWDAGWRAHSSSHVDAGHADTHSDSDFSGHHDAHIDYHTDVHADEDHADDHGDASHTDVHEDATHADDHGDSAAHTDVHVDTGHADTHGDILHSDQHNDKAHSDSHSDAIWREDDDHCDKFWRIGPECLHEDAHGDAPAEDAHFDSPHTDQHADEDHDDQHADIDHSDFHNDGAHSDFHSDASHADGHSDGAHVDEHGDDPHVDEHLDGVHDDQHADAIHSDWHADGEHVDAHTDLGHQDAHTDSIHTDSHADGPPHEDAHTDVVHQDAHGDDVHADSHDDAAGDPVHTDVHVDEHQDTDHEDVHSDSAHADQHDDTAHGDFHGDQDPHFDHVDFIGWRETELDPHCDSIIGTTEWECHGDFHTDIPFHTDTHSDVEHADIHDDTAHEDQHDDAAHFDDHDDQHDDIPAHVDQHSDAGHFDVHADEPHEDAHTDVVHFDSHLDEGHSDTHTDSVHTDQHSDEDHDDAHRDGAHNDVHADLRN